MGDGWQEWDKWSNFLYLGVSNLRDLLKVFVNDFAGFDRLWGMDGIVIL